MCAARHPHETPSGETKSGHMRVWGGVLPVLILVLAVGLPRLFELDRFITTDEPTWVRRSASFYTDLVQHDFANTFKKEHPGVTVMWAGSAGILSLQLFAPEAGQSGLTSSGYTITVPNQVYKLLDVLVAARLFMVLGNTLAIALAFVYARHLLGPLVAFVGSLLIAFDPFHVAHSRLLHLDALTSSLLLLAFLAFMSYLHRRRVSALMVSGVALGLAGLTRSTAVLAVPAILLVALLDCWTRRSGNSRSDLLAAAWQSVWPLLILGAVAFATILALWPAMWVDPIGTMAKVIEPALSHAVGGHENPLFFNGQIYPDGQIDLFSFYPITYLWRSTPVVLAGLLVAGAGFVLKRGPLRRSRVRRTVVGLMLLVVVVLLLQSLGSKKFDRYLLPVYAALDLIAGTGYVVIAKALERWRFRSLIDESDKSWTTESSRKLQASWKTVQPLIGFSIRRYAAPLLLAIVVAVQAIGSVRTFPYYLSYYNPLMGGSRKAPETMLIGWGEGLDQAAEYLTELSEKRALMPASWYLDVFAHLFRGQALNIPLEVNISDAELQYLLSADYAVIYIHQWQRQMPKQLLDVLAERAPVHSIWIDGLEYVRVYNLQAPPPPAEPSQTVQEGNLGDMASLVGYDPSLPVHVEPGTTLPLTLTWECVGTFEADYTVFVHLVGADRRPVAQADSQPLGGDYPTTRWHAGERMADPYQLEIPPDLPPGEYELLVGMYLLSSGERLPLLSSDGQIVGDSVLLDRLEIAEP